MPDTFTANLSLTKPEIGASTDTWGNKTNANWDSMDSLFPSARLTVANGGTGAGNAADARTNLGLGSLATASAVLESQITDGTILARVGSAETVTGNWTFSGTVALNGATTVPAGTVTAHQAALTIAESQITDGSVLARVGGAETITGNWSFTGTMTKTGQGRIPYLVGSGNTGGAITVSSSAASGTPANGDIWIQYVP